MDNKQLKELVEDVEHDVISKLDLAKRLIDVELTKEQLEMIHYDVKVMRDTLRTLRDGGDLERLLMKVEDDFHGIFTDMLEEEMNDQLYDALLKDHEANFFQDFPIATWFFERVISGKDKRMPELYLSTLLLSLAEDNFEYLRERSNLIDNAWIINAIKFLFGNPDDVFDPRSKVTLSSRLASLINDETILPLHDEILTFAKNHNMV